MKIGVVSELTGGSDICHSVTDLSTLQAKEFLGPGETILFALSSPKDEYAFTNESLVAVCGESAMSTKRTVERCEYIHERISHVTFESCGITDRDCELKFHMGARSFSIDIAKAEQPQAQHFYRVLQELSRAQAGNARNWDFAKSALDSSVRAMRISDPAATGATLLVDQATSVQTWLQDTFAKTNPRCYQAVIQAALERVPHKNSKNDQETGKQSTTSTGESQIRSLLNERPQAQRAPERTVAPYDTRMWKCGRAMRLLTAASKVPLSSPHWSLTTRALTAAAIEQGRTPVDSLYVTSTEFTKKTSSVLIGLAHTLEQKFSSVGYFRPIAPSPTSAVQDHHMDLMHSELELPQKKNEIYGVTSERALEYWLSGKSDDLVEEILNAFENCKKDHDFMIIEGSPITEHESAMSWKINVDIARAIGSPVLLLTDLAAVSLTNGDLVQEIVSRTVLGKEQVEAAGLNYFGTIANRVRAADPQSTRKKLREIMAEKDLPFLGFLPQDELIASKRLNEVAHKLGAKQLFGTKEISNNVIVSDAVVATSHLRDLFAHLKKYKDGVLVITSADRSDILLGLLASRIPGVLPNVAGIVLTNGDYPHSNTHEILQGVAELDKTGLSIPIFVVPHDTYNTSTAVSRVSTDILPTSIRKIGQCKTIFDEYIEKEMLIGELDEGVVLHRSPKHFKHFVLNKARAVQRHIVLTEGEDIRVLQAADEILRLRLAKLTILGDPEEIRLHAKTLSLDLSGANIVKTVDSDLMDRYAEALYEKRKHKGMTMEVARDTVAEETYFGTMMVEMGDADGMVSGACHTTANTIRPALQLIKTSPERPLVSSVFFMCLEDGVRIYGDCAVNTNPTAEELAQIAVTSAESAEAFGMIPRVALLSYATGDSNTGPIIDKVRKATKIAQEMRPDLDIYGPIQYDAAVDEAIAKQKLKADSNGARVGGHANVLIFPDLNTGNNTYKAVQQSTQCIAMGPMLQGLRKPVNDLSRGATVKDIVTTVAITSIQAEQMIVKRNAAAEQAKKN